MSDSAVTAVQSAEPLTRATIARVDSSDQLGALDGRDGAVAHLLLASCGRGPKGVTPARTWQTRRGAA